MAVMFSKCDIFFLFFVNLLGIISVSSVDDLHFYGTFHRPTHELHQEDIKLLDRVLINQRHKREIAPQTFLKISSTNAPTLVNSSDLPATVTPDKQKVVVEKLMTGAVPIKNATGELLQKNLGENGHGIRQNITKPTITPSTVQGVIQQAVLNKANITDNTTKYPDLFDEDDFDENHFNQSLKRHNITESKTEQNKYYISTLINDPQVGHRYRVNLTNRPDVKINRLLSKSYRRASTVKLSFDFPFYGHMIKNVTIATGGFLYTGDYVHSWLAATQYIAPLMANFDTSLSNESLIRYADNGTAFTVEWEKVSLQDRPTDGQFTFQVTLLKNGDIIFVYANIPIPIEQIKEHHHPVKIGLSDAYIMDQTIFLVRRKTIYEYERVHFNKTDIRNWTSIYLQALPTCLDNHDCNSCLQKSETFHCRWCPVLRKCSDGYDRHRQEWIEQGCEKTSFANISVCSVINQTDLNTDSNDPIYHNEISVNEDDDTISEGQVMYQHQKVSANVSGIVAIVFLIGMATGFTFWVFYAYRNPHTTSGQMLIRYRPSQWRWRRGEARYTAATIHM